MHKEELERTLDKTHQWILSVDQKISIALAFAAGVLVLIATPTYQLIANRIMSVSLLSEVLFSLYASSALWVFYKLLFALRPRTRIKTTKPLTFFSSIANHKLADYKQKVRACTKVAYKEELVEQIHVSATIAHKKHVLLSDAIVIFAFSWVAWLGMMVTLGLESTHA